MATRRFSVTWDYRCPFARNLAEHVLAGLDDGADWEVGFVPFSLNQAAVGPDQPDAWDDPALASSLLAVQVGIVLRDHHPGFPALHRALFAARHDQGRDLRQEAVLADVLAAGGIDPAEVMAEVSGGGPLATFRKEHEQAVAEHSVFGVPTLIAGDRAVFVRVLTRPGDDTAAGRATVERLLELLTEWPELNEFKHTTIPR